MLVVSLALAAVLIARNDDGGSTRALAGVGTQTPVLRAASNTLATSPTPKPTATPGLSADLKNRLQALPDKLRNQTLLAYDSGDLSQAQVKQIIVDYEERSPNLRVGSVLGVSDGKLRLSEFTTGQELDIATTDQTQIRRGDTQITLADLTPDELVMVVSTDNGATAQTIDAFGVAAP